ncbi:MAG TPA: gluconate:H+ symporter [Calditrichia bacterium]|nr:gluconate transporter [Calditrichota bacterium]HQV31397.1 gluconate:H+ symporter [Calditrichia bacterium]
MNLIWIVLGIALLLIAILRWNLPAFPALLMTSILVGLLTGLAPEELLQSVRNGMGGTLGFVAIVVGLGAMLGKLLEEIGGINALAATLLRTFGEQRATWALGLLGFLVAIPVFFDVGFIILVPLIAGLSRKSGRPILLYAIPLLAGLVITHSFIPPTPGPIAVVDLLKADISWVIIFGTLAGLPAMAIAGPLFGRYIAGKIPHGAPEEHHITGEEPAELPGFWTIAGLIILPLALIILNTSSKYIFDGGAFFRIFFEFVGHPFIALLITTLILFVIAGRRPGFSREGVSRAATAALEPAGIIILVTGAGGVFKQVLVDSGMGTLIAQKMAGVPVSPIVLAFLITGIVRVVQGSATVAMISGAGMSAPILEGMSLSAPYMALVVVAISAGATIASHVNDSGFWLVSRYLGLDEKETLMSWTTMTTLVGAVALGIVLLLSLLVHQ